jgi:hypothetical protein
VPRGPRYPRRQCAQGTTAATWLAE